MKRNTIGWRIFRYNLIAIIVLIALTTVIFNIAIRIYFKYDTTKQLDVIANQAQNTALKRGPDFFPSVQGKNSAGHPDGRNGNGSRQDDNSLFQFYFMLDRSLRQPLSMLNADYILLDSSMQVVTAPQEDYTKPSDDLVNRIREEIKKHNFTSGENITHFTIEGTGYIAVINPVQARNSFGLSWIIVYSSLQKLNQMQLGINLILFAILIIAALVFALLSSYAARKISEPLSSLNQHIRTIAERNFSKKIQLPAVDELQEIIDNINTMSGKLETYDKAQKTFLQNASHEFRTPLMSIRSFAEGIKYDVVEPDTAADVILDETKRMTRLVEDLLYLSRLDAIEENYTFEALDLNGIVKNCADRLNQIAAENNINFAFDSPKDSIKVNGDDEMLSRAVTNILSNCIRYAKSNISITLKTTYGKSAELCISDDGPGFDEADLSNVFERFYKGKKGIFGLGLTIAKNVVEKHGGSIMTENSQTGALIKIVLPLYQV